MGWLFQRNGSSASDTYSGTAEMLGVEAEWSANAPTDD